MQNGFSPNRRFASGLKLTKAFGKGRPLRRREAITKIMSLDPGLIARGGMPTRLVTG